MVVQWTCPPDRLDGELAEVARRLEGLRVDERTWSQERNAVLDQIREPLSKDDWGRTRERGGWGPGAEVVRRVGRREAEFARLSLEDVRRLEAALLRPDRAILAVAGDFDTGGVAARVRETFGALRPPAPAPWMPAVTEASGLHGIVPAVRTTDSFYDPRLILALDAPRPEQDSYPVFLACVSLLRAAGEETGRWRLSWDWPMGGTEVALDLGSAHNRSWDRTWDEAIAEVQRLLAEPPGHEWRGRTLGYARRILGLDDWNAARSVDGLETAAYLDALAAFKGIDREAIVRAAGLVSAPEHALAVKRWFTPVPGRRPRPSLMAPTRWSELPNGLRAGVLPLRRAERASVAFLLPFGRETGPSPVVSRLFAHVLTPGWGVSPWSVQCGRDYTVLWWAGEPRSVGWVVRDLAARLKGAAPTEQGLATEREKASQPDPYPGFGLPPAVTNALMEGTRAIETEPAPECPSPSDVADAASQIAAWFTVRSARVVVAGPFGQDAVEADAVLPLLAESLAGLDGALLPPATVRPPAGTGPPGPRSDGAVRICRAFAVPPTAPTVEFAALLLVGLRLGVPCREPLDGEALPPVVFDPLLYPGVLVFSSPPGRPPSDPGTYFLPVEGTPGTEERQLLKDLLGDRLGPGFEILPERHRARAPSPVAAAVRAALLDFRGIDGDEVLRAIDDVTPEIYAEVVGALQRTTPVEFRLTSK